MGRRRGTTAFPVARIKKMMQSDDDVGKIATATPVLVAKALECMMEDVLRDAAAVAIGRRTKTVTPQHLKHSVTQNAQFDFLRAILNGVPALDDPNAPPVRRTKRPRSQAVAADAGADPPPPAAGRPKRPRAPRSPTVQEPAKNEEALDTPSVVSPPVESPPDESPPVVSPSVVSPPVVRAAQKKEEEEDEDDDYDDCDEEMETRSPEGEQPTAMESEAPAQKTEPVTPQPADMHMAPLILQEQPGLDGPHEPDTPVVIRDFGIAPQVKGADDGERQKVKAAERVSVHALLS